MAIDMKEIETGENTTTEFKREYTDDLKKTIIAFANSTGGLVEKGVIQAIGGGKNTRYERFLPR